MNKLTRMDLLVPEEATWMGFSLDRAFTKDGPRTRVWCGFFGFDLYWKLTWLNRFLAEDIK